MVKKVQFFNIRNVPLKTAKDFKMAAAKEGITNGKLFERMVNMWISDVKQK